MRKFLLAIFVLLLAPCAVFGADPAKLILGIGAGSSISEYESYSPLVLPFPIVEWDNGMFYINGFRGGFRPWQDEHNQISAFLQYDAQSFYNSRTDNSSLQKLDDRYSSLYAGLNYRFLSQYGIFDISGMTDILGVSNGTLAEASYSYPIPVEMLTIVPTVGCRYADSQYNDYYYGISSSESRKSQLSEYDPSYGFTPFLGLTIKADITENFAATVYGRGSLLDNEVADSPMVDKDYKASFGAMISYSF